MEVGYSTRPPHREGSQRVSLAPSKLCWVWTASHVSSIRWSRFDMGDRLSGIHYDQATGCCCLPLAMIKKHCRKWQRWWLNRRCKIQWFRQPTTILQCPFEVTGWINAKGPWTVVRSTGWAHRQSNRLVDRNKGPAELRPDFDWNETPTGNVQRPPSHWRDMHNKIGRSRGETGSSVGRGDGEGRLGGAR